MSVIFTLSIAFFSLLLALLSSLFYFILSFPPSLHNRCAFMLFPLIFSFSLLCTYLLPPFFLISKASTNPLDSFLLYTLGSLLFFLSSKTFINLHSTWHFSRSTPSFFMFPSFLLLILFLSARHCQPYLSPPSCFLSSLFFPGFNNFYNFGILSSLSSQFSSFLFIST